MSDLVVFLRARLDEDEQAARAASPGPWEAKRGREDLSLQISNGQWLTEDTGIFEDADAIHIARHDPARVLAEVDAKRAFIEDAAYVMRAYGDDNAPDTYGGVFACEQMFKRLAAVYADHPDYRQEWRP